MKPSRWIVLVALIALLAAACGRSDDAATETEGPDGTTSEETAPDEEPDGGDAGLDDGAFGDLGVICQEGEPAPATEDAPGLTDDEVRIATFTDVGFEGRAGLNEEFIDTAEAFADWCNSHGGINGREIVVDHRDAKLTEYQQRVLESCEEDFFMVGGGGVFDDSGQADRLACGLPDISGFMVTPTATESDLHLEPIPNPITSANVTDIQFFVEAYPEASRNVWDFRGDLPTTRLVAERYAEASSGLGVEYALTTEYSSGGEANWKPFVQEAKDAGAQAVFWVGEPANLAAMMQAADEIDFDPAYVRADANHYETNMLELGGDAVNSVITKTSFFPFERAEENEATQQYLDLMAEFNPDGKIALLGAQGLSAWLLFVTAANECDAAGTFTRDCIYQAASVSEWSGGGLHSPQDVAGHVAGECQALLHPEGGTFVAVDEFEPNEGPWRCSPDSVVDITGDYGDGAECPSGAEDPLPSTCSG